jgi:hypothetical protein
VAPNKTAAIAQRKIKLPPIIPHPSVKSFRRLQLAFEPTECSILLHGIGQIAAVAPDSSRSPARQWDELQPRATPWTPAIFDLSHADILADRSEVSILNVVVMIEYSTLGGAQQMLTYR